MSSKEIWIDMIADKLHEVGIELQEFDRVRLRACPKSALFVVENMIAGVVSLTPKKKHAKPTTQKRRSS